MKKYCEGGRGIGAQLFYFLLNSSEFDEKRLKNQFLLLSMKINVEDNYIIICDT